MTHAARVADGPSPRPSAPPVPVGPRAARYHRVPDYCFAVVLFDEDPNRPLVRLVVGMFGDQHSADRFATERGYRCYVVAPAAAVATAGPDQEAPRPASVPGHACGVAGPSLRVAPPWESP